VIIKNAQQILTSEEIRISTNRQTGLKPNRTFIFRQFQKDLSHINCKNCGKFGYFVKDCRSPSKRNEKNKFGKINAPRSNSKKKKNSGYDNEPRHKANKIAIYNSENSNTKLFILKSGRINIVTQNRINFY